MEHTHRDMKYGVPLYFAGLALFILSNIFVAEGVLRNILLFFALLLSGFYTLLEGVEETYYHSKQHKKFMPNAHILMALSAIGAMLINSFNEAVILILIFAGAHYLEEYVEKKSKKDISSLLKMKPTIARKIINGKIEVVDVNEVKVGDILAVLNGDQVPLDGIIIKGNPSINESAINGESIPRDKTINDTVFAGTMNLEVYFEMQVTKEIEDTLFAKILKLVSESQKNTSRLQSFISKYEPKYVIGVMILSPIVFLVFLNHGFEIAFYRALVFLVSVSPCAIAVSVTPATLSAISFLARNNVLFKQSRFLMYFKDIKAIAFDKTGTLTTGNMKVDGCYFEDEKDLNVLYAIEAKSNHPIAKAIVEHLIDYASDEVIETENLIGKGIVANTHNHEYAIGKASAITYTDTTLDVASIVSKHTNASILYFTKDARLIGILCLVDSVKAGAKEVIAFLNKHNVDTIMITGDNKFSADYVANELNLTKYYYEVLPDQKNNLIKELQKSYGVVAMVGDGVNDAIALANADISIAMGQGSDIAIDTSDVVLMKDDIHQIEMIFDVSKRLDNLIKQNLIFAFSVIAVLFVLNFFSITNIFTSVLGHEGSTFIILLNSLRLLFIKQE